MKVKQLITGMAGIINKIQLSTENIFLVIVVVIGILMATVNPPFQECDGYAHFLRAMDVSYGNVLLPAVHLTHDSSVTEIPVNLNDLNFHITEPNSGEGGDYIVHLKNTYFSKETTYMISGEGTMALFYYPQALGLFLGRCIGLSVWGCVFLSRLINLLAFMGLAYTAIKITPVLKNVMTVIALFPMTVYQASSQSPDALLNGLCLLFAALCLYYAYGKREQLNWKDALKLGVVLGLVFLCKYIYICLGLLVFLIPAKKFGTKKEYFKSFGIALIPLILLAVFGFMGAASAVTSGQASSDAGITQLEYLRQKPGMVLLVLVSTFKAKFTDYMLWLNTLGSLNYSLGPLVYLVPMFTLYVAGSDVNEACAKIKLKDRILALLTFGIISAGIVMGIYIGDGRINEVGSTIVQGVQGRYFIAALPALFLAILPVKIKNQDRMYHYKILGCMTVFLFISVSVLKMYCR